MDLIVEPNYVIFFRDVVNVYYFYQLMGLTVWYIGGYYKYATMIVIMVSYSLITEFLDLLQSYTKIQELAHYECDIEVRRELDDGQVITRTINSSELVPGDLFKIPNEGLLPCDAIMVSGETIVNEAMLTGESIPSIKSGVPNNDDYITTFSVENQIQVSTLTVIF
jgi:cation-transporting ATPase 13A2